MKIDDLEMEYQAHECSLVPAGDWFLISPEVDSIIDLMRLNKTVVEVIRSDAVLFADRAQLRSDRTAYVSSPIGLKLIDCLKLDFGRMHRDFPVHSFNPYLEVFFNVYRRNPVSQFSVDNLSAYWLNVFVEGLRGEAKRANVVNLLANHRRGSLKNSRKAVDRLERMFEDYPKLLLCRIDLGYKKSLRQGSQALPSGAEIKADFERLIRYVRRSFPGKILGYMWTLEFGAFKGPHYHVLFVFDGGRVRQGVTISRILGEHWENVITNGRGSYFNVNTRERFLESRGKRGIGLISRRDLVRRQNATNMVLYLTKVDFFVRVVLPGITKTFGCSQFKQREKSNSGRKRKPSKLTTGLAAISAARGNVSRFLPH